MEGNENCKHEPGIYRLCYCLWDDGNLWCFNYQLGLINDSETGFLVAVSLSIFMVAVVAAITCQIIVSTCQLIIWNCQMILSTCQIMKSLKSNCKDAFTTKMCYPLKQHNDLRSPNLTLFKIIMPTCQMFLSTFR